MRFVQKDEGWMVGKQRRSSFSRHVTKCPVLLHFLGLFGGMRKCHERGQSGLAWGATDCCTGPGDAYACAFKQMCAVQEFPRVAEEKHHAERIRIWQSLLPWLLPSDAMISRASKKTLRLGRTMM